MAWIYEFPRRQHQRKHIDVQPRPTGTAKPA